MCPTHCTTGNYRPCHQISALFKWGQLICRLGVGLLRPHACTCLSRVNRNGHICMIMHTRLSADTSVTHVQHTAQRRGLTDTHAHRYIQFDAGRLECRGHPAVLFINIRPNTRGSALLSRASLAPPKCCIKLALPFWTPITSCSVSVPGFTQPYSDRKGQTTSCHSTAHSYGSAQVGRSKPEIRHCGTINGLRNSAKWKLCNQRLGVIQWVLCLFHAAEIRVSLITM